MQLPHRKGFIESLEVRMGLMDGPTSGVPVEGHDLFTVSTIDVIEIGTALYSPALVVLFCDEEVPHI